MAEETNKRMSMPVLFHLHFIKFNSSLFQPYRIQANHAGSNGFQPN